jgi:hypothetical protein
LSRRAFQGMKRIPTKTSVRTFNGGWAWWEAIRRVPEVTSGMRDGPLKSPPTGGEEVAGGDFILV